jgi:hypothetical protein
LTLDPNTRTVINTADLDYCEIVYSFYFKDDGIPSSVYSDTITFLDVIYDNSAQTVSLTLTDTAFVDGKVLTFKFEAFYRNPDDSHPGETVTIEFTIGFDRS